MSAYGKVAIVIGSRSDYDVAKPAVTVLDRFGVESEIRIISAHRSPMEAHDFAVSAEERGFEVLIGVAGKAAHLAGVLAGYTTLPVIALPVQTSFMGGLDSLLSMVQMPKGVPRRSARGADPRGQVSRAEGQAGGIQGRHAQKGGQRRPRAAEGTAHRLTTS